MRITLRTVLTAVVWAAVLCTPTSAAYLEYVSGGFSGYVEAVIGTREVERQVFSQYPSLAPLSATLYDGRFIATGMASARVSAQAQTRGTGITLSGEATASTGSSLFRNLGMRSLYAFASLLNYDDSASITYPEDYLIYRIAPSESETVGNPIMLRADFIADRNEIESSEAHYLCGIMLNGFPWATFGHEGDEPLHADRWECSLAHIGDEIAIQVFASSGSFRLGPTWPYHDSLSASFTLDLDVFYFEPLDPRDFPYEFDPFFFNPVKVETGHYALMELTTGKVHIIPAPTTLWLLGSGLLGLWGLGRRLKT